MLVPVSSNQNEQQIHLSKVSKKKVSYLFKYLLAANFLEYLEAGALPALLMQLTSSFQMKPGEIGLLGGIVYLSLSIGAPFAEYLLRNYDHQLVVGWSLTINNIFTLCWALTPIGYSFSSLLFISLRFLMGLTQCVVCIFMPLWCNEFAPKDQKTTWMSYQQVSVPFGVMSGYIIASLITNISHNADVCLGLLCWRWPFIIEVILLIPLCIGVFLVPREHVSVKLTPKVIVRSLSKEALDELCIPNANTPLNTCIQKTSYSNENINDINRNNTLEYTNFNNLVKQVEVNSDSSCSIPIKDEPMESMESMESIKKSYSHHDHVNSLIVDNNTLDDEDDNEEDEEDHKFQLSSLFQDSKSEYILQRNLRRHSMAASMIDPFYTKSMMRSSFIDNNLTDFNSIDKDSMEQDVSEGMDSSFLSPSHLSFSSLDGLHSNTERYLSMNQHLSKPKSPFQLIRNLFGSIFKQKEKKLSSFRTTDLMESNVIKNLSYATTKTTQTTETLQSIQSRDRVDSDSSDSLISISRKTSTYHNRSSSLAMSSSSSNNNNESNIETYESFREVSKRFHEVQIGRQHLGVTGNVTFNTIHESINISTNGTGNGIGLLNPSRSSSATSLKLKAIPNVVQVDDDDVTMHSQPLGLDIDQVNEQLAHQDNDKLRLQVTSPR